MSQENVEIVRRAVEIAEEGVRRGDPGAAFDRCVALGLIASNLEWRGAGGQGPGWLGLMTSPDARGTWSSRAPSPKTSRTTHRSTSALLIATTRSFPASMICTWDEALEVAGLSAQPSP
jgi:hypothetical protein